MTLLARVAEERDGDLPVAVLHGEIDASNTAEIGARLRELLTNDSVALVVDLTPTAYLDSAGITMLFRLAAELGERQQRLHVVVPPDAPIARAIAITGLDAAVPIHATRADAVETAADRAA